MVFKTRIKRSEMIFNIIVLALFAVTAATTLLGAYGAICYVWELPKPGPPGAYWTNAHVKAFLTVYQISNVLAWITAFAWGYVIYAYFTKMPWKRFFIISITVSTLGFLSGVMPAIISDTAGFTEAFDFGSPNWARAIGNLLMMIIILMMQFVPRLNVASKKFIEERNVAGQYAKQLILMALFFFWLATTSFLGTEFMKDAHVIDGINVWQLTDFQFIGGVITSIIGTSMVSTALIYNQIRPSSALITTK